MKTTMLVMAASTWLLVPTGTPEDIVVFYLIGKVGATVYALLIIALILAMLYYRVTPQKLFRAMKQLIHKVTH